MGLAVKDISIGFRVVSGFAYPEDAVVEIKVERDGQVIFTATTRPRGMEFTQVLKEPVREDDEVTVRVTAPDFTPTRYSTTIY